MENRSLSEMVLIKIKEHLNTLFPQANIYTRQRDQGIIEPCFLLRIRKAEAERQFKPQYWYRVYISLNYLPEDVSDEHLEAVKEEILFTFDEVPFINNTHLRFVDMNCDIYDGTLSFSANSRILVEKEYEVGPYMEVIEEKTYTDPEAYDEATEKEELPNMWKPKDNRNETNFKMWQSDEKKAKELDEMADSDSPKSYLARLKKNHKERKEGGGGVVWLPR